MMRGHNTSCLVLPFEPSLINYLTDAINLAFYKSSNEKLELNDVSFCL